MEKTQNYNLNQWEASDPIRREDFNADNAAIDAALKVLTDGVPYVVGTYTGTSDSTKDKTINLGFQPSMVIISKPGDSTGNYGTTCTRDEPAVVYNQTVAAVTETGFVVKLVIYNDSPAKPYTNSGGPYVYIAFR